METWRDLVIIVYGIMGIVLMFGLCVAAFGLWFAIRELQAAVQELIKDPIRPTLVEVRKTAENLRGSTEFIADTAVHPLIRIVSITRGFRRGIASVAGLRSRVGGNRPK